ncbi:hypothetical protein [Maritimibacter sp. UBA3975]|uniref:hypothetical protein n=1 Tax=Maritimibacter sp. UBA3975 TaxID=1946833 RepID=UPI000C0A2F9F|nr:hypothetical protein [Maritimibacter sp. UBA3975]MAM61291.1 hypothetical protein [Maritimibacter sp.]|tara:strand:- start:649 stop:1059 length:411 start_codon:yes stop_codon:yes gene_type:complete
MTTEPLPPGEFHLTPERDDRVRQMSGAPARLGARAHPIFAFVGALGGLPMPIKALSESLGLAFDQGPVLAGCVIDLTRPLEVGRRYTVAGRVEGITRKPSRRFGHADHLHLAIALGDGAPFTEIRLHIIFPAAEAP